MLQGVRLPMTDVITSQSSDRPGRFAGGTKYQEQEGRASVSNCCDLVGIADFFPYLIEASVYLKLLFEYIFAWNDAGVPEGANVYAFLTTFQTGMFLLSALDFPLNVQPYGLAFLCGRGNHGQDRRMAIQC